MKTSDIQLPLCKNGYKMNWDNFRIFLEVARSRQLSAAARKLRLNHATVARRLTRIEEDLHESLVERLTSGCELTEAGERLFTIAERIESAVFQAQSSIGNTKLALSGGVRIGAPDGFGSFFLAPRLASLTKRYPLLKLQLVPLPHNFSLAKREVDIAITIHPPEGRLSARKLVDYGLSFYATKSYLEKSPKIETIDDLNNHTLITYVPDLLYSSALNYFDSFKSTEGQRFECASVIGQLQIVMADGGVGILHDFLTVGHPNLVRVLPEIYFKRAYWLATHVDVHELRRIRMVEDFILGEIEGQEKLFMPHTAP